MRHNAPHDQALREQGPGDPRTSGFHAHLRRALPLPDPNLDPHDHGRPHLYGILCITFPAHETLS